MQREVSNIEHAWFHWTFGCYTMSACLTSLLDYRHNVTSFPSFGWVLPRAILIVASGSMSQIAKLLLVATSLAPALGAFALIEWQKGRLLNAVCLLVAGILLVAVCCLLILYVRRNVERQHLEITAVESTDKDSLAFLIAYLFPLFTGKFPNISEREYWLLTVYVFAIMGLTVYHSNAFHFNPILALFGYHFYQITADKGMKYLLIAREVVRVQNPDIEVVKLSDYVYLEVVPSPATSPNTGE